MVDEVSKVEISPKIPQLATVFPPESYDFGPRENLASSGRLNFVRRGKIQVLSMIFSVGLVGLFSALAQASSTESSVQTNLSGIVLCAGAS